MYHLRLIKARSYCGAVEATRQNPDVFVEDEAIALSAVSSGYFKLVESETGLFPGLTGGTCRMAEAVKKGFPVRSEAERGIPSAQLKTGDDDSGQSFELEPKDPEAAGENHTGKTLEGMTVPEIETFAAYKGVSLKGLTKKADMIVKLREELGAAETENEVDYGSPTMTELQGQ